MEITRLGFKGSLEEFQAVAHLFADSRPFLTAETEPPASGAASGSELIRRVLERRPVSPGQAEVFKALQNAGTRQLWRQELANAIGRPTKELDGILGTLGRRVNQTPGVTGKPGLSLLIHCEHSREGWCYSLQPEFLALLESDAVVGAETAIA